MVLTMAQLDAYYAACAPAIGASTIAAIVKVESGGNPWAINDNTTRRTFGARTYREAVGIASNLVRIGHSVDMGLTQVNSRNLARVGMTIGEVLEPCRNLMAAARILTDCYLLAAARYGEGQGALVHALGCYNTGSLYAGKRYVARVLAAALGRPVVRAMDRAGLKARIPARQTPSPIVVNWPQAMDWRVFR